MGEQVPATGDIGERLDRIEQLLAGLQAELAEIRASAAAAPAPRATAVEEPPAVQQPTVTAAWHALERGRDLEAVETAEAAFLRASAAGRADELAAIAAFASAAAAHVTPDLAARLAVLRPAGDVATRPLPAESTRAEPEPTAPADVRRAAAAPTAATPVARPVPRGEPPAPRRATVSQRVDAWARRELTGSRLFALGGGVLMLLGVVFLFVVAANRGWVGPGDRVVLGTAASLLVLVVGLVLRSRYGRLQASLAAVGAGIAGLYATLAAATILYGFVPAWAALLLAAGIASIGGTIALAWSSQMLAGLALVGAAAAPGLVALDDGITAPAPAFAVVVLAATVLAAARRRWLWLVAAVGATSLPQVIWLIAASPGEDWGAVAVAAGASLVLLGAAVVWQATAASDDLDGSAATMGLLGAGLAFGAARTLLPDVRDEGIALAATAVVYGVVAVASGRRWRDLGWVVGAAALLLAAVATADLLSGRSLSVVLAVEAVVLAALARRLGSPRFALTALGYLLFGLVHVGAVELDGALDAGDVPRAAAPALLALAAAALAVAALLPGRRADPPSTGLGAALEPLWEGLVRRRPVTRVTLAALAIGLTAAGSAALLSGSRLAIAWAGAAAAGGVVASRRGSVGFALSALAYLALGAAHVWVVELDGASEAGDVPRAAASALFCLAVAALVVGLLLPERSPDTSSAGIAKEFEPVWAGLVRERASVRAVLIVFTVALAALGSASLLSGRWLTVTWAAASVVAGLAGRAARERRLVAVALPPLALGVGHALAVEAPVRTLALERGLDPLAAVPSLAALGVACAALAAACRFAHRGIRFLGPLQGPERALSGLDGEAGRVLRATLVHVAAVYGAWVAGLVLVDVSYAWGQVGATSLWAALGLVIVARSASTGSWAEAPGWGIVAFAYLKSIAFDWNELAATPASTSLLVVSAALLLTGFASRWLDGRPSEGRELLSLFAAAVATVTAVVAVDHLVEDDRALGGGLLIIAAVLVCVAVPPFRRARREGPPGWPRTLATGYWVLGLIVLLLSEAALTGFGTTNTLTLWSATAAALALGAGPAGETRVWVAALAVAMSTTIGVVSAVTPPDRLVDATAHPGEGFSALVVVLAAAVAVARAAPGTPAGLRVWLLGWAGALGLLTASLAVLELAERVSGASVETDFQRGHTALSTLLGLGALAVYAVGLARDHRPLRLAGLTLFGLALGKLFLYDLSTLSSITRALSFLALGAVLLAAAFFAERAVRGERGSPGEHAGPRTV